MISGRYIAPSFAQQLNPIANILAGQAIGERADEKQLQLARQLRSNEGAAMADFMKLKQGQAGTPDQITEMAGPYGQDVNKSGLDVPMPTATMAGRPAVAGNPQAAYSNLYADPRATAAQRQFAFNKMTAEPESFTLAEGAKRFITMPDGSSKEVASGSKKFQKPLEINTGNGTLLLDAESFEKKGFVPKVQAAGENVNPQEAPLRNKFLDQIQPHIQITQAYGKITSAPDTAAGDMSKIFGFMKILDPGSTVREGEYASAEQTRGIPEAVVAQYNRAVTGKRLTTEQRERFDQAAGDLVNSQKKQFDQQKDFFTSVATNARANPANIIYDPYKGLDIKITPPKPPEPTKEGINFFGRATPASGWSIKSVK
jgi:hypothetical protein